MSKQCAVLRLLVFFACWTLVSGLATAQTWEDVLGALTGDEPSQTESGKNEEAAPEHAEEDVVAVGGDEADLALREALLVASQGAVKRAARTDGFLGDDEIRINLPGKLGRGRATLVRFGLEGEVEALERSMNRAAEGASGEALPEALREAIKNLVIDDPLTTLAGGDSAATDVLAARARVELGQRLAPIVKSHVGRQGMAAALQRLEEKGGKVITQAGVDPENLTRHVTDETVAGLLVLVARGEREIRSDPKARTTPLIAKVFASPSTGSGGALDEEAVDDWPDQGDDRNRALKQALILGARRAVGRASQADGFWGNPEIRIPLPRSVDKVGETLRSLGMGSVVDDFELSLNRAAEKAAAEATPILVDAVKNVGFEDVLSILTGGETAATDSLRAKTETQLAAVFKPIIATKMDDAGVTRNYDKLMERGGAFVTLLGGGQEQDLPDYVTGKALDGLFALVAEEEVKIRKDPAARTTELLERIFGALGG